MSMEQDGNQNIASPIFCRNGCGFYAAQAFDGMCSKCYKDLKQIQNQSPVSAVASTVSSPSSSHTSLVAAANDATDNVEAVAVALGKTNLGDVNVNSSSGSGSGSGSGQMPDKLGASGGSEVETASPTVATVKSLGSETRDELIAGSSAEGEGTSSDGDKGKKPKKNRCAECRKKVGLTGFVCHCGKLFCSLHRYTDTHECSYDFKEKGAEEIRKNNPVIKGEKIQKI